MKRLCLVVTDAISFNVLYRGQLEHLKAQGFQLTLLCGGSADEIELLRRRDVGKVVPIKMVRPPRIGADLAALLQLLFHFLRFRYDMVLVATPKAILLGSITAWLTRQSRRVVFFKGRVYENFSGFSRSLYLTFDRIAVFCAHEVLFVSRSLMAEYRHAGDFFTRKGRVLGGGSSNGVNADHFDPENVSNDKLEELKKSLGIEPDAFVVLTVGRISMEKGLAEMEALTKRAAQSTENIRFVMVGPVEAGCESVLTRIQTIGNVSHVGFTDDVSAYFAIANVHLFLTHREGFGNVAIEAAVMGVPTIGFDVVGVRDSVAEGVSGVRVPFGDVETVWQHIERMRRNPKETEQIYSNARQWALENFDQNHVWELFERYCAR
ncbi:glycosyltransferase [Halomonas sp. PAMB 3264]|uniref:glycosyltransferase n=1 Tax=Halomonas sp. PAMB 3264 TaxID=3075222 RepID=UPI002897A8B9|nr:glycosyltransferase [Halomonas sp. PAMB 3264]WNL42933.1 glycosyltransferase [Halomonas sp. PAMB 3264]